jgi:long-chain fatty acid transport protein
MFGMTDGPGFGWDDQTVIKVGLKQQVNPKLAVMVGYNHGDSPMGPEDTFFGALTPAVVEDHLSLGWDYKLSKNSSIVGSYTHTFANEVKGDKNADPNKFQPFDLEMDQDAFGIGFSKKF